MRVVLLGEPGSTGGRTGAAATVAGLVRTMAAGSGDLAVTEVVDLGAGFAGLADDAARDARLTALLAAAGGDATAVAWDDPSWELVHAVAAADAVVLVPGTLGSSRPDRVYENVALARLAARFSTPVVVADLALVPPLTPRHRVLVAELLAAAALVGVTDAGSRDRAVSLGAAAGRLALVVDDAARVEPSDDVAVPDGPYVVAALGAGTGLADPAAYVASAAALLEAVAAAGMRPLLLPTRDDDLPVQAAIAEAASAEVDVRDVLPPSQAARLLAGARLVVGTHAPLLATSASTGTPVIGVAVDGTGSSSQRAALSAFGLEPLAVSVASLVRGDLEAVVADVLGREGAVREVVATAAARRSVEGDAWSRALTAAVAPGAELPDVPYADVQQIEPGAWATTAAALRDWSESVSLRSEADQATEADAQTRVSELSRRVDALERERADLAAELALARDEVDTLRVGAQAAYELAGRAWPLAPREEPSGSVQALEAELRAVYATRTFRYLERPRLVYRRLRTR